MVSSSVPMHLELNASCSLDLSLSLSLSLSRTQRWIVRTWRLFVRNSVGCACTQVDKERAGGGKEGGARSGVGAAERRASDYATIQVHFGHFTPV
jgi:hypothetical protein